MNTISAVDRQISRYLLLLTSAQKKAVLGVVKAFADEHTETYELEMNNRFAELESGRVTGHNWDQVVANARQKHYSK
jgi:hypothetical protein